MTKLISRVQLTGEIILTYLTKKYYKIQYGYSSILGTFSALKEEDYKNLMFSDRVYLKLNDSYYKKVIQNSLLLIGVVVVVVVEVVVVEVVVVEVVVVEVDVVEVFVTVVAIVVELDAWVGSFVIFIQFIFKIMYMSK